MKRWIGNFTAALLFFTVIFTAWPKFLWDLGRKKRSAFILFLELAVIIVVIGLIWFLIAAFRAIVN
ncbi:MAG: hypothetical protein MUC28_02995 [Planctomycetes bacterium]|jgi:hypothetical protein|nr:hypothetical protein [Planctomycetota bacterium]